MRGNFDNQLFNWEKNGMDFIVNNLQWSTLNIRVTKKLELLLSELADGEKEQQKTTKSKAKTKVALEA